MSIWEIVWPRFFWSKQEPKLSASWRSRCISYIEREMYIYIFRDVKKSHNYTEITINKKRLDKRLFLWCWKWDHIAVYLSNSSSNTSSRAGSVRACNVGDICSVRHRYRMYITRRINKNRGATGFNPVAPIYSSPSPYSFILETP